MDSWVLTLITNLVEALLHGALELIGYLSISITVEDSPSVQSWLGEHLGLNLSIKFSGTLLNVELVGSSTTG